MRAYLWLSLLCLLGALLPGCAAPAQQAGTHAGGPRLAVDQQLHDYGDVAFDQPIDVRFTVTNVGDKPLVLQKVDLKVRAGC